MDPGYETVVDPTTIVYTMTAMVIHGVMVAAQLGLAAYLLGTGTLALLAPGLDKPWLQRLGAEHPRLPNASAHAAARVALGLALLAPFAVGASFAVSLAASFASLAVLASAERGLPRVPGRPGRLARGVAMACAAVVAGFSVWEGEDGLDLGVDVIATAQGWRAHELDWQLENDLKAPKVGDVAPDFALQDPEGGVAVRLSDFRGKRPVALVFGSYT